RFTLIPQTAPQGVQLLLGRLQAHLQRLVLPQGFVHLIAHLFVHFQDLSHMLLLEILSSVMTQVDNEVMPGMKELEFQRKAVRQLPLSQRERKAGCRNFFWKTYTSC
uniref:Somatostatin/Cortistatin C-terminal domain-containing protein n=1 Tax=Paramormyrops kingsleyae TaxID=1676925 RepID=A0A3B3S1F5_9TELE